MCQRVSGPELVMAAMDPWSTSCRTSTNGVKSCNALTPKFRQRSMYSPRCQLRRCLFFWTLGPRFSSERVCPRSAAQRADINRAVHLIKATPCASKAAPSEGHSLRWPELIFSLPDLDAPQGKVLDAPRSRLSEDAR